MAIRHTQHTRQTLSAPAVEAFGQQGQTRLVAAAMACVLDSVNRVCGFVGGWVCACVRVSVSVSVCLSVSV